MKIIILHWCNNLCFIYTFLHEHTEPSQNNSQHLAKYIKLCSSAVSWKGLQLKLLLFLQLETFLELHQGMVICPGKIFFLVLLEGMQQICSLPCHNTINDCRVQMLSFHENFKTSDCKTYMILWCDQHGSHMSWICRSSMYSPVYQPADALINILFSSGTTGIYYPEFLMQFPFISGFRNFTWFGSVLYFLFDSCAGEPKAIPWTQLCPIRCGADTWANLDVRPKDISCLPTNLGWVMGPIQLFLCFLNGATLALYHGSPLGRGFCKFVQVWPILHICWFINY